MYWKMKIKLCLEVQIMGIRMELTCARVFIANVCERGDESVVSLVSWLSE